LDGVGNLLEAAGGVGVGAQDQRDAGGVGGAGALGVEIEAAAGAVEFHGDVVVHAGGEDGLGVVIVAVAAAEDSTSGVAEAVEEVGLDGAKESVGHRVGGEVELFVDAADDPVAGGQQVVIHVEFAILEDVDFDAREQADAVDIRVGVVNAIDMRFEAIGGHAVGDAHGLGVVGDGDVLVPEVAGGAAHLFDAVRAVGLGGVHVDVASNVARFDEIGEVASFGCFDFTVALTDFGGDVREVDGIEEIGFSFGGERVGALRILARIGGARIGRVAGVGLEDAVLADLEAHFFGAAAHFDVMLFASGEVVEGSAKDVVVDEAEIDLKPIEQVDRDAGVTALDDVADLAEVDEGVGDVGGCIGGDEDIDVADSFAAAAQGAGDLESVDGIEVGEFIDQGVGSDFCGGEWRSPPVGVEPFDFFQDGLLCFGAEAAQFGDPSRFGGLAESVDGGDIELFVNFRHAFGAESLNVEEVEQSGIEFVEECVSEFAGAGVVDLAEIVGDGLPDALELFDGAGLEPLFERFPQSRDGFGGVLEGSNSVSIIASNRQKRGDILEDASVVLIVHDGEMAAERRGARCQRNR